MTKPEAPEQVSKRFQVPLLWAQYHTGQGHICVDGRTYNSDCLVTDPDMDDVARWFLAKQSR